jgi:hypothetical protein
MIRLQEIKNELHYLELMGQSTSELKKFRTTILDPTIDQFKEVARFESRKIAARQLEMQLDKDSSGDRRY